MKKLLAYGVAALLAVAAAADESLMLIRLRGPHTADDAQWAKTFAALAANRGACDEVWFSTGIGFPEMDWHKRHAARLLRYAEQLRGAGIVPSLQFQATLGHSDELTLQEGVAGKAWGGFTGSGGIECKACNCPRQPAFLAYVREMARLYAAFRPAWVWVDDDLRVNNHRPASDKKDIGCWCRVCLEAFNAETGGKWTRAALAKAIAKDAALYDSWERFSSGGDARGFARDAPCLPARSVAERRPARDFQCVARGDRSARGVASGRRLVLRPEPERAAREGNCGGTADEEAWRT